MMITVGGRRCGSGSLVTNWFAGDGQLDHAVSLIIVSSAPAPRQVTM
jgi:hypothetical protein